MMSAQVKNEGVSNGSIKNEVQDTPSPYMDDIDDAVDDTGDLDFNQAQQQLWLSHIPRTLWEALSHVDASDEIEVGTIRVEGSEADPSRVSLMLNKSLPQFEKQPKEYNLCPVPIEKKRNRIPGDAYVFSERDQEGYKSKSFRWDDVDDEGNPGQGRSYLYERNKRDLKRKEAKGRFTPYAKRSIPKQTAVKGTVVKEYEAAPVKNKEFYDLENDRAKEMLRVKEKTQTTVTNEDTTRLQSGFLSMQERANITKASQVRKQAAKESRSARMEKHDLIDKLLNLFRQHKIWGLRDLKAQVNQPESYLRSVLEDIAFMWRHGDFNGKWELKDEYKQTDNSLLNPAGMVAPKAEDSDLDKSGIDDDDDEPFEDV